MNKVILVVRDGWGFSEIKKGNAILNAETPFDDFLLEHTEQVLLGCSGQDVGLPEGFQGSSEVGHLNMGAGRIVEQEVTRIFKAIRSKDIFDTSNFLKIRDILRERRSSLHLVGLLQDEGVHAHEEHLFELIKYFKEKFPDLFIWIHPISDGRDTPPRSFLKYFKKLKKIMNRYNKIDVGTIWGRYYGMDRSKQWHLIEVALKALLNEVGYKTKNIEESIYYQYKEKKTPDGVPMFDEYIEPIINENYEGISKNDIIVNFNYRQDRAIEISKAFVDPSCPVYRKEMSQFHYFGLTKYYDGFKNYFIEPMVDSSRMKNLLGEVISKKGYRQLRIAETQKFRHVTSFFNGKRTTPNPGEDQIEIPSEFDPSSFATHPEMNAEDVTKELLERLNKDYSFVLVNYANCDMVGHTGNYYAAKRGAEIVDKNVEIISQKALEKGFIVIITADHGNAEEMIDENGDPKTSHTTNPVKLHVLNPDGNSIKLMSRKGILSDIAPLVLKLMDIPIPSDMTSLHLSHISYHNV